MLEFVKRLEFVAEWLKVLVLFQLEDEVWRFVAVFCTVAETDSLWDLVKYEEKETVQEILLEFVSVADTSLLMD